MMGVYIKGVEMPKDGEHPYWVTIHSDGIVEYNENKGQGWQTSEAVPVPPHGDLVDGDAYRDEFMARVYELCNDDPDNYRANEIIDLFDSAPTVIPAEPAEEEQSWRRPGSWRTC